MVLVRVVRTLPYENFKGAWQLSILLDEKQSRPTVDASSGHLALSYFAVRVSDREKGEGKGKRGVGACDLWKGNPSHCSAVHETQRHSV